MSPPLLRLALLLTLIAACSRPRAGVDVGPEPAPTAGDASVAVIADASADGPADAEAAPVSSLGAPCDGGNPCEWEVQACVGGRCVACPEGTISLASNECKRTCDEDSDCRRGEICTWLTMNYHLCTPRPPLAKCPKGQVAIKTGACVTPCRSDKVCAPLGADMCCEHDSNAGWSICRACGTGR